MKYILIFLSIILSSSAQIFLKLATSKTEGIQHSGSVMATIMKLGTNGYLIFGLFMYFISAVLWVFGISKIPLSVAYPLVSVGYIIVVLASYYVFGEALSLNKVLGLVLIICGVIVLSRT